MGYYRKYLFDGVGGWAKYDVNGKILADHSDKLSGNLSDAADAAGDFAESLDWIEIRMEEIDERLSLLNAELENSASVSAKNSKINQIITENYTKMDNAMAGAEYYEKYAQKFFKDIPKQFQDAAKNGAIAITDFTGEANEAVVEAIQNYRDYTQKGADLRQQIAETITEIRDLAIQRIDNAYESGSVRADVEASQTEKLQNRVDLDEAQGEITSDAYYYAMMENSNKTIEYLTTARDNMQKELNEAVKNGEIIRGSNEWYEQINAMYGVQAEIDQAKIELEEYQTTINDLHWERFEQLIDTLDNLQDETQSLIDLMENEDLVVSPETDDGWSADQVEWTKEGMAALGLYAQQMEIAEFKANEYANAIEQLNKDYKAKKYSDSEYAEKLKELKDAQMDNIQAYHDAEKSIVDLNQARIDEVKDGVDKQIDAYDKLIQKQIEALDTEKDLHDFQRSAAESSKKIADIQRKLAALAGDNSASATAKRRQLEAELLEAKQSQEDLYYDRSVENQKEALNRELEDFQTQKEAELQQWEQYLENVEQVVADSLGIVQANATEIGATLTDKAEEYNLTLSNAILEPWSQGSLAVSDYQTTFDTAMSSTTDQLEALKAKWQEVIDKMAEYGERDVTKINAENEKYAQQKKEESNSSSSSNNNNNQQNNSDAWENKIAPSKGNLVTVKKSATHFSSKSGGVKMASFVPGGQYTVYGTSGTGKSMEVLIGRNGTYTGWVKLTDLQGYAKGTTGVKEDQLAWIDEHGLEELVMHAGPDGRLQYLSKGTSVLNSDLTERIMDLAMNPQAMIDQNRPTITAPHITNNEIHIDASVGKLINIEEYNGGDLAELEKMVSKQFDQHVKNLNNSLKRYTRG